jgi:hypothetical protein
VVAVHLSSRIQWHSFAHKIEVVVALPPLGGARSSPSRSRRRANLSLLISVDATGIQSRGVCRVKNHRRCDISLKLKEESSACMDMHALDLCDIN